eukprot:4417055-Amphidinium_carterae.1
MTVKFGNEVNLRRTIYLIIMSSLQHEECVHKILKLNMTEGQEKEVDLHAVRAKGLKCEVSWASLLVCMWKCALGKSEHSVGQPTEHVAFCPSCRCAQC